MVKRRARLEDNDPLSSTDRVLAGFEQMSKSASQQSNQSTSQEADVLAGQPNTPDLASSEPETASQQSDKLTIQQVDNIEKPKLRKSTFQISETVLLQLDQVHLTLQLELGKAIAPYKEVIVEEALVRLLEQFADDRSGLIEVLVSRQKSRDKP